MKVFQIGNSNISCKGNVLNMEQDAQSIIDKLPLTLKELSIFVMRKNANCDGLNCKDFKVNRNKILR